MEQRTDEWKQARCGKITASRWYDIFSTTKTGYAASRANYASELACERLTGIPSEHYVSKDMERGTERESGARVAYEMITGNLVEEVAFIDHPKIPMCGASPDGLIGSDGGLEIKCPNPTTHFKLLTGGAIDQSYVYQMVGGMMCTGRTWWDFCDYNPDYPDNLQIFIKRFYLKDFAVNQIEEGLRKFNDEVNIMVEKLLKVRVDESAEEYLCHGYSAGR